MQDTEVSALKTLRSGFFYLSAATAMAIAVAVFMPVIFVYASSLVGMMGMAVFVTVLMLSIVVIFLYAIFGKIRPGMRQLSEVDGQFRICYTGTTLMLVGLAVLTLGIVVNMTVGIAVNMTPEVENALLAILGLGGVFIGYAITFIGHVLTFAVGAFKLHGRYRNPLYAAAGTFFVLSIFLTPIGLLRLDVVLTLAGLSITAVGYVLMHIALGGTIKKLKG
jgi:hypothetical protein